MKRSYAREVRWLILALAAMIPAAFPFSALAQDRGRDLPRWLLDAFREVISEPAKSTVQVYSDGYRSALGAIVRPDGHVVTKASELKGKIECQLAGESQKREARIVARDSATDLAILKIEASNLPVVPWTGGDSPGVGSWLATPDVSRIPRSIGVVSVAARKLPPNGALGIRLDQDDNAARIAAVVGGMGAEKAGLAAGDVIRKIDGEEIKGSPQLQQAIRAHHPGDKVTLIVERDGKMLTLEATLSSMSELLHDERSDFQNSLGGKLSERRTGFPLAIQHDSFLQPADCGGPIVDLDGKVVGLNVARAGRVESYALPASVVRETVDKLLKTELTSTQAGEGSTSRKTGQER